MRGPLRSVVGLAPWYQRRTFWGGAEIRFLGTGETCSDYLSLLAAPDHEQAVVETLAKFVASQRSRVDRLFLEGVAQEDRLLSQFAECLRTQYGFQIRNAPALGSYRVALPPTWDEYLSQLSPTRRQRVRQMWRNQFDTGQATVCVATDEASLQRGLAILVDLHQQRQRQLGHPGCFASPQFKNFLYAAAQQHLATGHLRLQWIELDGQPIAAEFDLLSGNVRMHYCSGIAIDTAFPRPGWLGISAAIRHAINEGCKSFDFLRGDEGYKSHWRGEPVPMVDWESIPPTGRARVRQRLRTLVQATKRQVKRVVRRRQKEVRE